MAFRVHKYKFLGCWSLLMTLFWTWILVHVFKLQCPTSTTASQLGPFWCCLMHLNAFHGILLSRALLKSRWEVLFWIRWRCWQLIKQNSWMHHQTLCQNVERTSSLLQAWFSKKQSHPYKSFCGTSNKIKVSVIFLQYWSHPSQTSAVKAIQIQFCYIKWSLSGYDCVPSHGVFKSSMALFIFAAKVY